MSSERRISPEEGEGQQDDGCRDWRDEWRREKRKWKDKAYAWDPELWNAMATAWAAVWKERTAEAAANPKAGTDSRTCPYCAEEIKLAAIKCKHCGTWLSSAPDGFAQTDSAGADFAGSAPGDGYLAYPRLSRSSRDAMAFGVLGGFGRFFGIDPTWLRIAFALGTFFTAIVPGIVAYAILAAIIPSDTPSKGASVE